MDAYKAYWSNFKNFSDRTNVKGYWIPTAINIAISIVLNILSTIFAAMDVSILVMLIGLVSLVFSLAILVPSIAIAIRRLRDQGREWYFIFTFIIPIVGLVFMCLPSAPEDGTPVV